MAKNTKDIINQAYLEIQNFPKAKNGKPFLTLKNGRKLFFEIFIKKYGLNGDICKYTKTDVLRRVRVIEFFDCFIKRDNLNFQFKNENGKNIYTIESNFYRMTVLETGGIQNRFELLSFYNYK